MIDDQKQRVFGNYAPRHWNAFSPIFHFTTPYPDTLMIQCRWGRDRVEMAIFSSHKRLYAALRAKLHQLGTISKHKSSHGQFVFEHGKKEVRVAGITARQCEFILRLPAFQKRIESLFKK